MASSAFKRGLDPKFVDALNDAYKDGGWWKNLVDDRETFVAIRGGYLNVYYRGCSLIMLEHKDNRLGGEISYKYLLHPGLKPETVSVIDGIPCLESLRKSAFTSTLSEVGALKKAAEPYADGEKIGVHHIIHNTYNATKIVDTEIQFSDEGRIDLASLHEVSEGVEVRFYEAKRFSNGDLRARDIPKVIRQTQGYEKQLSYHNDQLAKIYRNACRNLVNLCGIAARHPERHELLKSIVDGSVELRINPSVWLIVFDFDDDQKNGKSWKPHRDKLHTEFGERLIMRGDPKDIRLT